jgi:hypothetical protein
MNRPVHRTTPTTEAKALAARMVESETRENDEMNRPAQRTTPTTARKRWLLERLRVSRARLK